MRSPRLIVAASQVPFVRGGAEILVDSLVDALRGVGCEVDVVRLPFIWESREDLLANAVGWRLLDLRRVGGEPVDRVIATRFPTYLLPHPDKVVWLIHQFRQVYDLLDTPWSDFGQRPGDDEVVEQVRGMDLLGLGEARAVYTISGNVSDRLQRFNGLTGEALYPPPRLDGRYRCSGFGDFVLGVGRLDPIKRFDLLLRAAARSRSRPEVRIAGRGPEQERLAALAAELGIGDRVKLLGWVDDEALLELYAEALAVFNAPFDEDYGYVTLEAFKSGKAVVTTGDAGGVLEFVADEVSGFVCPPGDPAAMAQRFDQLAASPELAARLGKAGREAVRDVGWQRVVAALTDGLPGTVG